MNEDDPPRVSAFIPNSFQTPNAYADEFMAFLTDPEWKVLSYTVRRIIGFRKDEDRIAISQYENGLHDADGNRLDYGTGLSRPAIVKALGALKEYGLVVEVAPNDPAANKGACYALQLDYAKVNKRGLVERYEQARTRGRKQTAKAREVKSESAVNETNRTLEEESGKLDIPHPVNETNRTRLMKLTDNNQLENQIENQNTKEKAKGAVAPAPPVQSALSESVQPTAKPKEDKPTDHPNKQQIAFITDSIPVPDTARWRETLHDWALNGWNPGNVRGMVDRFLNGDRGGRVNGAGPPGYARRDEGGRQVIDLTQFRVRPREAVGV
jgi:hypothetical protein